MPDDASAQLIMCKYLAYKYRQPDGTVRAIRLPIVHVGFESARSAYDTIALVDSGATTTHIPRTDADILQLEYVKNEKGELVKINTQGAGGDFNCNIAKIAKLAIMKNLKPFTTFRDVKVLVPESNNALPYAILGRDYLFERYNITFYENRQKIMFEKC